MVDALRLGRLTDDKIFVPLHLKHCDLSASISNQKSITLHIVSDVNRDVELAFVFQVDHSQQSILFYTSTSVNLSHISLTWCWRGYEESALMVDEGEVIYHLSAKMLLLI
jgi:hypothetical protein